MIHEARRSHPRRRRAPSGAFRDAPLAARAAAPPPPAPHVLGFDLGRSHDVRSFVAAHGGEPDFVLAVDELAANSIRHGGGRGVLRLWPRTARMVCDVRDRGSIDTRWPGVSARRRRPSAAAGCGSRTRSAISCRSARAPCGSESRCRARRRKRHAQDLRPAVGALVQALRDRAA